MNSDQIKGEWKNIKGKVQGKWSRLTENELDACKGDIDQLAGTIQKKYGDTKEQVKERINNFLKTIKE